MQPFFRLVCGQGRAHRVLQRKGRRRKSRFVAQVLTECECNPRAYSSRMAPEPSPWIARFAGLVPPGTAVLDVAAGRGRHTRFFLGRGHPVTAVDRDPSGLADLAGDPRVQIGECDLATGSAVSLPRPAVRRAVV